LKIIPHKRSTKISQPGIYSGVSIAEYHGDLCDAPSISSSGLRTIFNESPAHYWCHSPFNPEREPQEESEAFTLGRAAHHLLLGEDEFSTLFIQRPEEIAGKPWQGNRLECKGWLAKQAKEGRTVLKPEDIKAIRGMARSLAAHPLVQNGILNGIVEHSLVWKCKDTDLWKKARPDCIPNASGDFCDLKTTTSVMTQDLQRTIAEFGYHQQGALICEGYHAITGKNAESFSLCFVEKAPPYCCRVVTLWHDDLIRGERQNYAAMWDFARCLEKGEWPGPGDSDAEYLALPEWLTKRVDHQLEKLEAAEAA
jgi:hypothetical protein